jgi:hypothetical protein
VQLRNAALVLAVPFLLGGCGGDEATRVRTPDAGPTCTTDGTIGADPAPTLKAAVAPFQQPGQSLRISEKLTGTATVQLKDGPKVTAVVTLVHTDDGWAATSIARC